MALKILRLQPWIALNIQGPQTATLDSLRSQPWTALDHSLGCVSDSSVCVFVSRLLSTGHSAEVNSLCPASLITWFVKAVSQAKAK